MEYSNIMVVGLGLGTVFVGLIALIFICYIMGALCKAFEGKKTEAPKSTPAPAAQNQPIANKQEILAATCAVIAEELGCEANNIKVTSFKRV